MEAKNEIVVYQPDETIRLDVRLENETVWLTRKQMCDLFGVVKSSISYHVNNMFETNDNWVGVGTLDMLAKKGVGVTVTIVTSEHRDRKGNPLLACLEVKKCWHTDDFTIEKMRGMCYHSSVWTICNDECEKIQHDC